jgi:hypothetical protein
MARRKSSLEIPKKRAAPQAQPRERPTRQKDQPGTDRKTQKTSLPFLFFCHQVHGRKLKGRNLIIHVAARKQRGRFRAFGCWLEVRRRQGKRLNPVVLLRDGMHTQIIVGDKVGRAAGIATFDLDASSVGKLHALNIELFHKLNADGFAAFLELIEASLLIRYGFEICFSRRTEPGRIDGCQSLFNLRL